MVSVEWLPELSGSIASSSDRKFKSTCWRNFKLQKDCLQTMFSMISKFHYNHKRENQYFVWTRCVYPNFSWVVYMLSFGISGVLQCKLFSLYSLRRHNILRYENERAMRIRFKRAFWINAAFDYCVTPHKWMLNRWKSLDLVPQWYSKSLNQLFTPFIRYYYCYALCLH